MNNAMMATGLALAVALVSYFWRRPALIHSLWLLVLLKLITPPLVSVPLPQFATWWPKSVCSEPNLPALEANEAAAEPAKTALLKPIPDNVEPTAASFDSTSTGTHNEPAGQSDAVAGSETPLGPVVESTREEQEHAAV